MREGILATQGGEGAGGVAARHRGARGLGGLHVIGDQVVIVRTSH